METSKRTQLIVRKQIVQGQSNQNRIQSPMQNKVKPQVSRITQAKIPFELSLNKTKEQDQSNGNTQNSKVYFKTQELQADICKGKASEFAKLIKTQQQPKLNQPQCYQKEEKKIGIPSKGFFKAQVLKDKIMNRAKNEQNIEYICQTARQQNPQECINKVNNVNLLASQNRKVFQELVSPTKNVKIEVNLQAQYGQIKKQIELKHKEQMKQQSQINQQNGYANQKLIQHAQKQLNAERPIQKTLIQQVREQKVVTASKPKILEIFNPKNKKQMETLRKQMNQKLGQNQGQKIPESTISNLLNFANEELSGKQDAAFDREDVQEIRELCWAINI